jgi:hypothetical protein
MPTREVHQTDGVAWLAAAPLPAHAAIVTSMPDHSEMTLGFDGWKRWFTDAAEQICRKVDDDAVAVFYQSDVKHDGFWVDKSYLLSKGAEAAGSACLWHKIVCRVPPGQVSAGRPGYTHLLCFSRALRLLPGQSSTDVMPTRGEMPWPRAMGVDACHHVAKFLLAHTPCRTVVDPFCGLGTMLAVANAHGMDAIGVELSRKRAEKARTLTISSVGRPG